MIEKEFVPYDRVLRLRDLGFEESCFGMYNKDKKLFVVSPTDEKSFFKSFEYTLAPTFSQAFRWFREKYGMIFTLIASTYYYPSVSFINTDGNSEIELGEYETYEEAELACLDKLIEIVEKKF